MIRPVDPTQGFFDRYTIAHVALGWLYAKLGLGRPVAYGLIVSYELTEDWIKKTLPGFYIDPQHEIGRAHV